ncbi:cyclic nucleotide-gated ion channel 1-like isoform X2 [Quercus robur]|uniref:cyclic nucleotide-gated ion channel 1-like isoform X2 n=1 Tax=Quercus robur TaxID=38942 RepID=UPI0021630BD6|nr:cyclic nucleotide-gated ion channel 1-like isoform X2 [Quercus robur]
MSNRSPSPENVERSLVRNENKDIEGQCRPSEVVESASKSTFKPLVDLFLKWYEEILVLFRAFAVSLDPLFFYVPVIKEDKKCIGLNEVLWTIAIVSRSVTDVVYLVHFVVKSYKERGSKANTTGRENGRRHLWSMFNVLVILPIPQVLGAFWYFFSTQRLAACWHKAYEIHSDGVEISFNCDHSFRNISLLDDFCPIDTPKPRSTFDFGIFLEARRSGSLESTGFLPKAFYCFWWGMRNLSSFGSNLQTSSYIWENIFALGISIFGLLLFLYFIGNLQIYLEWRTTKEQKWRKRKKNLKIWMDEHKFDRTTGDRIIDHMAKKYDADDDVHVETLIPDLLPELRSAVNCHICLDLLKNLKIIKDSGLAEHEPLLLKICDSLQPMFYNKHCYIVREGDPIDAVFFITAGTVWTYTSNNGEGSDTQHAEHLKKDQYFGGELLELVLTSTSNDISKLPEVPISSKTLKTYTKVEAFALMAHDLKQIWQSYRINASALTCHN